jgi:hypothetical protein
MFDDVTMRGAEAAVVWGYHTAAVCKSWTVHRTANGQWTVRADVTRADPFKLRQRDLKFTVPRVGGWFCWPIVGVSVNANVLAATLGPMEA